MNFLIPAAGKGTRSGLNYPKCLYKIENKEIIVSILEKISLVCNYLLISSKVIILINKTDKMLFEKVLKKYLFDNLSIFFQYQLVPNGTASAVSLLLQSKEINNNCDNIIIWSDCVGFSHLTVKKLCEYNNNYDIIIPGLFMYNCYTYFKLNENKLIIDCYETKNFDIKPDGFTDIGIFKLSKKTNFKRTIEIYINSLSQSTENSFIDYLKYILENKFKIKFLDICKQSEKKGFNSMNDLI